MGAKDHFSSPISLHRRIVQCVVLVLVLEPNSVDVRHESHVQAKSTQPSSTVNRNLIGNSLALLRRSQLRPLYPPRLTFHISSDPPRNQCSAHATKHKTHSHAKRHLVPRSKRAPEQLRPHCTADLAVAIDKSNGKRRARGSACGLRAPGPHHWVPCRCDRVAYQGCGEYTGVAGVDDEHGVAREDDGQEGERIQGSWEAAVVGEDAGDGDDYQRRGCDRGVEDLCCRYVSDGVTMSASMTLQRNLPRKQAWDKHKFSGRASTHVKPRLAMTVD